MILGSHLSISGGLHKAPHAAASYGFEALAMFLRNQRQWRAPLLTDEQVEQFRAARLQADLKAVVAHGSYLLNLAGKADVRKKSLAAVGDDLDRAGRLGVEYLVLHPGSREDQDEGITMIAEALNTVMAKSGQAGPVLLLETTAGQGNCIGHRFEQIAAMLEKIENPGQVGVCFDTAHAFAAGYDIRTPAAWDKTIAQFDAIIGMEQLKAVHVNDSLKPLGSRVDRHAHIGRGEIGLEAFALLVNDKRFVDIPLILETPKGLDEQGRDYDAINADVLRSLQAN
jgi:deoxyribonuclease-4